MTILDKIYEAAFVPELWPSVLSEIANEGGAHSGALLLIDRRLPPLFSATPNVVDTLEAFSRTPHWYDNVPAHRLRRMQYQGFLERAAFFTEEERFSDNPYHNNMREIGADWQVGSVIDMPEGEIAMFTFERRSGLPDFDMQDLAMLDGFRPHLARASLMATRLKLERAQASVATMNVLGLPAGILTERGSILVTNVLFEGLAHLLRPAAFGRLSVKNKEADKLLQAAIADTRNATTPETRSIPMRLDDDSRAIVVHVVPLHRSARDIFDQGAAMVLVTGYSVEGNIASESVLRGLFDLSAAEAAVASLLMAGKTLHDTAELRGISITTARSHLAQVFRKTGTNQQGQLVALLKGNAAP